MFNFIMSKPNFKFNFLDFLAHFQIIIILLILAIITKFLINLIDYLILYHLNC